ncbi:hypothetical protein PSH92_16170 [Pseudomonas beijingensis]|jgi:hypothetical protein|uniref:DUF6630 domain-containing protein n=1 Tax=Pseudomonas beijingensis TaxID=2954101 RepID=A0ABY9F5Y6_9PSED|nr:hypothetical protein [Pseudomonas sp. FP2034]WLG98923.1 hypothetical protein PSH92_16170 [Pseudomonas sp. FP2034]
MGILDRLFGGRFTLPPPEETTVSDAAIMRELHPYRTELKTLVQTMLARMPEGERARLVRRVIRLYGSGQEPATALVEGLLDADRGQKLEHLALLGVDWRGFDGFEYLVPYLVSASGVKEVYPYRYEGTLSMSETLASFDQWLVAFDKRYLHLDSGGDEYVGFIADADQVEAMIELARQAGVEVRLESF